MNNKRKRITISIGLDLLFTIYQTRHDGQGLNERIIELLEKGIKLLNKKDTEDTEDTGILYSYIQDNNESQLNIKKAYPSYPSDEENDPTDKRKKNIIVKNAIPEASLINDTEFKRNIAERAG